MFLRYKSVLCVAATLLMLLISQSCNGFQLPAPAVMTSKQSIAEPKPRRLVTSTTTQLHLSFQQDEEERPEYSRETRLREEAESPFRKVRFFAYITLALGALTSLLVSTARIAAGLSGINVDLLQESTINAGVDVAGLVLIGILFQRDAAAEDSRLKRAQKGAALAKLQIQGSESLLGGTDTASEDTTLLFGIMGNIPRSHTSFSSDVMAQSQQTEQLFHDELQQLIAKHKEIYVTGFRSVYQKEFQKL